MAEPAGIFIEISLDEKGIKRLLNQKFEGAAFGKKLGYYFSELLFACNANPGHVFIFNHDKNTETLFIALLFNHFQDSLIAPFDEVLEILSLVKDTDETNFAIVASTFPEVYWAYEINSGTIKKISNREIPEYTINHLSSKFWSFSSNHAFPEPEKALKKRNYYQKNFKSYYKKYLAYIEESLKPEKIRLATKEKPYHLFDAFYTYDNSVFHFKTYNRQVIELPMADPLSLRSVAGIIADKNYAFKLELTPDSPPKNLNGRNNPDAKWQWGIITGIDGGSLQYVKEKWDTLYWKDKHAVYCKEVHKELTKVAHADPESFEYLGFCYGRDGYHVFFNDMVVQIHPHNFKLNENGFLYDQTNVFHYNNQIPLDAHSFKVLERKKGTNRGVGISGHPFNGTFVLEDKNGKYEYNMEWDDKLKKLLNR